MPDSQELELFKYHLQPGFIFTSLEPALVTTIVGTCVAVCLYDRRLRCGGVNHYFFPKTPRGGKNTPKYGNVAIPALVRMMLSQGCRVRDMEAQIFGGGRRSMSDPGSVGGGNVKMARKILKKLKIPIVSEDTGGVKGRRVLFHTCTNEAIVMKTHKIRRGDWHPYRGRLAS
jgi:chemotaxis protein CheD